MLNSLKTRSSNILGKADVIVRLPFSFDKMFVEHTMVKLGAKVLANARIEECTFCTKWLQLRRAILAISRDSRPHYDAVLEGYALDRRDGPVGISRNTVFIGFVINNTYLRIDDSRM